MESNEVSGKCTFVKERNEGRKEVGMSKENISGLVKI